jgi:hypothetical protein
MITVSLFISMTLILIISFVLFSKKNNLITSWLLALSSNFNIMCPRFTFNDLKESFITPLFGNLSIPSCFLDSLLGTPACFLL